MFVCRFLQSLLLSTLLTSFCYAQLNKETTSDTLPDKLQNIFTYPTITKYRNKFSIEKRILRTSEIGDILAKGDTSAFRLYQKGRTNQKTGVVLVISGGGLLVVSSIVALGQALTSITAYNSENNESTAAIVLLVAGSGSVIAGIVTAILGGEDKNKAVNQYNLSIKSKRRPLGFYVKPGVTGISLGLRF
ncbi:hypothetical protein [Dyadobacter sp. CY356]|uniref:hypothetical protein n=1 Tax=Dyadobacter sp. CY356 TaxID=2906442 RepID=UPI001F21FCE1|nr:hypothetical protein [Dyadobacter sp. CY356]MCF0054708.1 hypothetical protein [Dyadobacter sp. CY356]